MKVLLIGLGGFLGALSRYYVGGWAQEVMEKYNFPYGTIAVNMIGCLIIGFLGGLSETRQIFSDEIRLFIFIGFLGAFTTFSTFGYETMKLIWDHEILRAGLNVTGHVFLGLLGVWLGNLLSRII